MNQAEEFFSDLKEWSARKLNIIEKYTGGFSKILGSRFKNVYYIDGFAGKGMYDNGEKGSPVLAAETAQRFQQNATSFTLHCINVEKDHENYLNLDAETKKFDNLVQNYEGDFEDKVDEILSKINKNPAVFFIDPFGIKGTSWEYVEKVITRQDSTDIWIRFDHKTVRRLSGFYDSDAKEASGKLLTLQNLFGITDSNYLRERLGKGVTSDERIKNAVALYIEQLEKAFSKAGKEGFAASYPIISIDGENKYHLIFACSHKKAATLASDIVNRIEETFQHEKEEYKEFQSGQMSLFSSDITKEQVFEDKVMKLKKAILLLPKNKPSSREYLYYALMVENKSWFGKIRGKHLTQALRELLSEASPKIKCVGTPGGDDSVFTLLE